MPYPGADPKDFEDSGAGEIVGYGQGEYQFKDAASGAFRLNFVSNVGYPGRLVPGSAANGNNEVRWRDNEGVETVLVEGASPPVQVRNFIIRLANDAAYNPFVDFFSN